MSNLLSYGVCCVLLSVGISGDELGGLGEGQGRGGDEGQAEEAGGWREVFVCVLVAFSSRGVMILARAGPRCPPWLI